MSVGLLVFRIGFLGLWKWNQESHHSLHLGCAPQSREVGRNERLALCVLVDRAEAETETKTMMMITILVVTCAHLFLKVDIGVTA